MSASRLIEAVRDAGVSLRARLWCDAPDKLPPDVRAAVRAHEADILRELVHPRILVLCALCGSRRELIAITNHTGWLCQTCAPDWQYRADERAAIEGEQP